jgi:hypothetical protein
LYLHMEASQHSLLAACFTLHSINATLAIVPQRGAGLWIACGVYGGQSGTGAGFLRVIRFLLPIIPPISPLS